MFARKQRRALKDAKQDSSHGVADEASRSFAHSSIESDRIGSSGVLMTS